MVCTVQKYRAHFEWGMHGNAVPIATALMNALWTASRIIFWVKCTILQDFAYIQSQNFPGVIPRTSASVPGAWTLTPIFAWLASVPTVPVLRNDHSTDTISSYLYTFGQPRTDF